MLIFEFSKNESDLIQSFKTNMNTRFDEVSVDRLDGANIIQFAIPLAIALTPIITELTKTIRDLFGDRRVTIKYDEIELSIMGYEKAMKMLKEIQAMKNENNKENHIEGESEDEH